MDKCLFKEWCVKNNRTDLLDRWDYEKNNRNIDDVCLYSGVNFGLDVKIMTFMEAINIVWHP